MGWHVLANVTPGQQDTTFYYHWEFLQIFIVAWLSWALVFVTY